MSTDLRMMNFKIADGDRALLEALSAHNSDASFSAILRRLIRQEAERIGIEPVDVPAAVAPTEPRPWLATPDRWEVENAQPEGA